jgi:dolichyl-phosphate beta-glucosyltransferase
MTRTTIVVPCYNEAARLPVRRFVEFAARQPQVSFWLVNDGSSDATADLLDRMSRGRPGQIRTLHLPQNAGKAEAVRRGLLAAAAQGDAYLGYWDADLATPLDQIPRLADVLDRRADAQAVCGVRLPLLGCRIERRRLRRVLGRLFAAAASVTLGQRFCDTQCGAKLFRWGPAMEQVFGEPFGSRWIFDVELLARLRMVLGDSRRGIYELPMEEWRDIGGSKVRPRDFLRAGAELADIAWRYRFTRGWQPSDAAFVIEPPQTIPLDSARRRAA